METGPCGCADTHVSLLIPETKISLSSSGNNTATQSACVHVCTFHCKYGNSLNNTGNETLDQDAPL